MFAFLLVVQIFVSIGIITLVMLQHGKGADMGAAFGSGASGTVFGARGSGSFFSRMTAILGAVFFINCLLIASPLVRTVKDPGESIAEQIEQQEAAREGVAGETATVDPAAATGAEDLPADVPAAETVTGEDLPDVPAAAVDAAAEPAPPAAGDDLPPQ